MVLTTVRRVVRNAPLLLDWPRARQRWWTLRFRSTCARLGTSPNPMFVKVGANDGITGDPCAAIVREPPWRGLLIEPVPYCFARLRAAYDDPRFTLEQIAIGDEAGVATFYYVDERAKQDIPDLPDWYDQIGSFSRPHIEKHLGGLLDPYIRELQVQVQPLSSVLRKHGIRDFALLHIDAEGYDLHVLRSIDLSEQRPRVIYVEHAHLSAEDRAAMRALLSAHGYAVHDCGVDFFAELP